MHLDYVAQFEAEIERLPGRGLSCMVYSWRLPRKDPSNPWDLNNAKWNGVEFAPSRDDDIDPIMLEVINDDIYACTGIPG
jgi:hypothetical protein